MRLDELVDEHYHELNENDLYIWQYILHHKQESQKMTIKELALNCNVSHTSILRFTRKLGLEGFSELKVYLKWDLTDHLQFDNKTIDRTNDEIKETTEMMLSKDLTNIMEMIDEADRVFVYASGVLQNHMARELRREFIYAKKVFQIVGTGEEIDTALNNATKNDLFILISLSGDNETAVMLARALRGMKIKYFGICKRGSTLLSKNCEEMITFNAGSFYTGMSERYYYSPVHFFIISSFLFLRYLEYLDEKKGVK